MTSQCILLLTSAAVFIGAAAGSPLQQRATPNTTAPRAWKAPTYKGLVLGKSTKADVRRVFGKPDWIGHPEDATDAPVKTLTKYNYTNVGGFHGETWVIMNAGTGRVLAIELYPPYGQEPSFAEVKRLIGSEEFIVSNGPCPTRAQLRANQPPNGQNYPYYVASPERGVSVLLETGGKVRTIVYGYKCPR